MLLKIGSNRGLVDIEMINVFKAFLQLNFFDLLEDEQ